MNPPGQPLNVDTPQAARVYDALLGGRDNFRADRALADAIRQELPSAGQAAQELRRFLERVVTHLAAEHGIRQYLDIGCGLPHPPNVHDIAQAVDPASRVVYVDPDPLVTVHARALLTSHPDGDVTVVHAGLHDTTAILKAARATLDFTQPVAVLLLGVLHFIPDDHRIQTALGRITAAIPAGSYLAISHVTFDPLPPDDVERLTKLTEPDTGHTLFRARTHHQITALLDGLDPVGEGIVSVVQWRPEHHPQPRISAADAVAYGVLARKPATTRSAASERLHMEHR